MSELAGWLEDMQRIRGITYTQDDAEDRLRTVLLTLVRGQAGVVAEVSNVGYWGYREVPRDDGNRLRTTLRMLDATITMPDGGRYHMQLIGPYSAEKEGAGT